MRKIRRNSMSTDRLLTDACDHLRDVNVRTYEKTDPAIERSLKIWPHHTNHILINHRESGLHSPFSAITLGY